MDFYISSTLFDQLSWIHKLFAYHQTCSLDDLFIVLDISKA
jgi:hypothetical protein